MRDRIKKLVRVPAHELIANPKNWRSHPDTQRAALRAGMERLGFADVLLAREDESGALILIDGHLRAEEAPTEILPVVVLDVTEAEAEELLLTLDPIANMAEANRDALERLIQSTGLGDSDGALGALMEKLMVEVGGIGLDDEPAARVVLPEAGAPPTTSVRGYMLFLNEQTLPELLAMDTHLRDKLGTSNTTDTVLECVRRVYRELMGLDEDGNRHDQG